MARSEKYKSIIMVIGFILFVGCVIAGSAYGELLGVTAGWIIFFIMSSICFIFCMVLYMLADILDRLEIISAQNVRATKVLENFEDKQEEKEKTK